MTTDELQEEYWRLFDVLECAWLTLRTNTSNVAKPFDVEHLYAGEYYTGLSKKSIYPTMNFIGAKDGLLWDDALPFIVPILKEMENDKK